MQFYSVTKIIPLALALTLGACASYSPTGGDLNQRSEVTMVRLAYVIAPQEGYADDLSLLSMASLSRFLGDNNVGYGDTLLIDQGSGVNDGRVDALVLWLKSQGHKIGETDGVFGGIPMDGGMTLYIERYLLKTPDCPNWSDSSLQNMNNANMSQIGCATTSALDAAVADPRDLIDGQNSGNSTSAATKAASNHQQGVVTDRAGSSNRASTPTTGGQ